ncbi:integrase, catalytic region, zinc finger, CCHC-type containing protein [Tanacetum coccineum]
MRHRYHPSDSSSLYSDSQSQLAKSRSRNASNKRNAELVQENDLLKSTLSGKEKSIAFLQSEKEKILSEKKDLADSYLDEIVCLKNANKVARDMLQRFNMPTHTIPMLSKKPKAATADLHKDLLGTRNPGLGYMAKRAQPVLYDADTLLHPTHHPVSIWDSEEVLVHQVVSMKKMNEKPGHIRPKNGFYEKLNALKFVPQQELSREQAYWLPANEIASQASNPDRPVTPFVHNRPPPSQVLFHLQKVNAVFHQFEGIINERTTQKPLYVSEWCFDYAKQFVEQQLVPFYDHFKKHIESANETIFKEVKEYEQIFDDFGCGVRTEWHYKLTEFQLQDMITSLRIQLDGLKVENVSLKRRYDELSKANTHSRIAYTEKLSALTSENTKLKAHVTGQTSSGPSTSKTPKVLAPGMYNLGSKYIPPPKCANWDKPTPLPKKKQVTFVAPPRPSLKPTQNPVVHPNKQTNVCVPMSTGVKPTSGASKTVPKRAPRNHSSLPAKSANARRVEAHHRTLNKKNRVDSNLLVKHSVSVSNLNNVVQIVLWYLDSGCSRHMTGDRAQLINFVEKFIGIVRFGNDEYASIVGYGKSKKASHPLKAENTNTEVLHTLHMDLCGPMRTESINGKKYVLVIVDDYTRFGWVRFLRTKDETPQVIEKFIVKTQRALNATVRFVRTDNGTEFVNKTLDGWFESVGISHETSVPRSPQQNGVVERRNRTLMEAARTMLIFAKAPLFLWAEAVATELVIH